jgi:hypothetical protein
MAEALGTGHTRGSGLTTSRVMAASRPKVSFWPDGITSPGNYGCLYIYEIWYWAHIGHVSVSVTIGQQCRILRKKNCISFYTRLEPNALRELTKESCRQKLNIHFILSTLFCHRCYDFRGN